MNLQMLKKAMLAYVSAVKFIWSGIAYPLSIVGKKFMNLRGYRIYGKSVQDVTPTPDNPVEIECVGDLSTKNLFDKNNALVFNGYIDSLKKIAYYNPTPSLFATLCINCKPNTTYTVSRELLSARFVVASSSNSPAADIEMSTVQSNNTGLSITITTGESDAYLYVWFYNKNIDKNYTYQEIMEGIQIEEGTTATDYEPYHKYKIPVLARGRNLIKLNKLSHSANGVTITNNQDGTYTLNGTPTGYCGLVIGSIPKSLLDVLRNNVCVLTGFYYYEKNVRITLNVKLNGSYIKYIYLNPYTYKNYVQVDLRMTEFDEITFALSNQKDNVDFENVTVKPLLEIGTTMPKAFEPYIEPVTTNIFLDEPLRKVGDYADYVDFEKQKVVRPVEVLDDTGTKTIDESLGVINPPTEETVKLPALPQFKGTTIYEVGTNIKPSGMEVKYC